MALNMPVEIIRSKTRKFANQGLCYDDAEVLVFQYVSGLSEPLPVEEVKQIMQDEWDKAHANTSTPELIDANELWFKEIKEPDWIVPGILPVGLTLLAGKPKCGKSWLAYEIALNMATGGQILGAIEVQEAGAMMLALEDTPRRLQQRMKKLLLDAAPPPNSLSLTTHWPTSDVIGLREALKTKPNVKLLIVDTLARFRPKSKANADLYAKDYEDMVALKSIADNFGIAVLVIHHTRKSASKDPFETVSGTLGLTGAVDTIWVLQKESSSGLGTLHVRGRDVEEQTLSLKFSDGHWTKCGDFPVVPSPKEAKLIELLSNDGPQSPKSIADKIGEEHGSVSKRLQRMVDKGLLIKINHGMYASTDEQNEKAI